jgi:cytidine deaminase
MQSPKVYCAPCGACRQFLYEFATPETLIVGWNGAEVVSDRLFDLIPKAFGPQNLLEPGQ